MAPHRTFRSLTPRNPGGPGLEATTGIEPVERSHRPRRRGVYGTPYAVQGPGERRGWVAACPGAQAGSQAVRRRWTLAIVHAQAWPLGGPE